MIDRKKDIFKYLGYHINPSELENSIEKIPGVEQVAVIGLPSEKFYSLATAAVVKSKNSSLTSEEVKKFVEENFPSYKHLHGGVYFFPELPMNQSGKIIRQQIKEKLLKMRELAIELDPLFNR